MTKSEITKAKIIQATVRIAVQKGFANTHTAEIAKEAGVSEGLIFKYFPSKNRLFAVIIDENFHRLKNGVEGIIADRKLNASAKIAALVEYHFRFFTDERNVLQLVFGHSDRKGLVDLESVFQHGFRPYMQLLIKILQEGEINGEFRSLNKEVAAMAIVGSIQVNILNRVLSGNNADSAMIKQELTNYILAGIQANKTSK